MQDERATLLPACRPLPPVDEQSEQLDARGMTAGFFPLRSLEPARKARQHVNAMAGRLYVYGIQAFSPVV